MYKISLYLCIIISALFSQQENYFQQEVNHIIKVELDDEKHTLTGNSFIEYNPDFFTLDFFWA